MASEVLAPGSRVDSGGDGTARAARSLAPGSRTILGSYKLHWDPLQGGAVPKSVKELLGTVVVVYALDSHRLRGFLHPRAALPLYAAVEQGDCAQYYLWALTHRFRQLTKGEKK